MRQNHRAIESSSEGAGAVVLQLLARAAREEQVRIERRVANYP